MAKLQLTVFRTFSIMRLFCVVLSTLLSSCQIDVNPNFRVKYTISPQHEAKFSGVDEGLGSFQVRFFSNGLIWLEFGLTAPTDLSLGMPTSALTVPEKNWEVMPITTAEGATTRTFAASNVKVVLYKKTFCAEIQHAEDLKSMTICPKDMQQASKTLTFLAPDVQSVFGLGQHFLNPKTSEGSLLGQTLEPGPYGNELRGFSGGANSVAQFPTFSVQRNNGTAFFTLFDNNYRQLWKFGKPSERQETQWEVTTFGEKLQLFVGSPGTPAKTRAALMDLIGQPPVPPRKMFGLWVSEFGYDSWTELEKQEQGLRDASFPLDGMILDLQWFGGEFFGSRRRMGTLEFDEINFPNPKQKIADLKARGLGLMTVEESYVDETLSEHTDLGKQGFLVRACEGCVPARITQNPWWGKGGMLDWTHSKAAQYWHNLKRNPLVELGIIGHWTDLGEPEMYDPKGWYNGDAAYRTTTTLHSHADYHNIYSLLWAKSIAEGYKTNKTKQRPFILTRSGTLGIQRYGAAMWSGDIGANLGALKAQFNSQTQMFYSGIDYYGSDAGGFHRYSLDGELSSLYTQWFAQSSLLDFPVRPHAWNTDNTHETSPAKVGHIKSNKANIELRYHLFPYLYSLAHGLKRGTATLVAPPSFYYPLDKSLAEMGHEKMIGPFLLAGLSADYGGFKRAFYFPNDDWFDFRTGKKVANKSSGTNGSWIKEVSNISDKGLFELPLYARDGAIIPISPVKSLDAQELFPKDIIAEAGLRIKVFPGTADAQSQFTLSEDDGWSQEYLQKNAYTQTKFVQQSKNGHVSKISWQQKSPTTFNGQLAAFPLLLEIARPRANSVLSGVNWGGLALEECAKGVDFDELARPLTDINTRPCFSNISAHSSSHFSHVWLGYIARNADGGIDLYWKDLIKSQEQSAEQSILFVCPSALTVPGEAWYVAGSHPSLGSWNSSKALKLEPALYPNWAKLVRGFTTSEALEWKCLKKQERTGLIKEWERGTNNRLEVQATAFQNIAIAKFSER